MLAFLVPLDSEDPQATYDQLRSEIRQYSPDLAAKDHVVVLTKRDLLPSGQPLPELRAPDALGVLAISSAAGQGVEELKEYLWSMIEQTKAAAAASDLDDFEDAESGPGG